MRLACVKLTQFFESNRVRFDEQRAPTSSHEWKCGDGELYCSTILRQENSCRTTRCPRTALSFLLEVRKRQPGHLSRRTAAGGQSRDAASPYLQDQHSLAIPSIRRWLHGFGTSRRKSVRQTRARSAHPALSRPHIHFLRYQFSRSEFWSYPRLHGFLQSHTTDVAEDPLRHQRDDDQSGAEPAERDPVGVAHRIGRQWEVLVVERRHEGGGAEDRQHPVQPRVAVLAAAEVHDRREAHDDVDGDDDDRDRGGGLRER